MAAYNRGQPGGMNRRNTYSRSAVSSSHYSQNSREDKAPDGSERSEEKSNEKIIEKPMENQLSRLAEQIFGSALDTDKLLVAALILLLLKEGADPKLIIALGYIFM